MKFIFGKTDANSPDDWVNEGVDSLFFSSGSGGSTNKDYKIGINFRNNHILFKGKLLINNQSLVKANSNSNVKPDYKDYNKMDIVDNNFYAPPVFGRYQNTNANINNFEKNNNHHLGMFYKIY